MSKPNDCLENQWFWAGDGAEMIMRFRLWLRLLLHSSQKECHFFIISVIVWLEFVGVLENIEQNSIDQISNISCSYIVYIYLIFLYVSKLLAKLNILNIFLPLFFVFCILFQMNKHIEHCSATLKPPSKDRKRRQCCTVPRQTRAER